jgi:hypothetical protein
VAAETVAILDKKYSKYLEAYKEWLCFVIVLDGPFGILVICCGRHDELG